MRIQTLLVALGLANAVVASPQMESGLVGVMDINLSKIAPDVYYEMHLLVPETITYRGYNCEVHQVTTDDGYILTLHRVLPRCDTLSEPKTKRPAVFLQHGLLDSSFTWVNNLVDQSLAFILVDNGFDVWLGNSRGNKYSRKHTTLNPDKDAAYWEWDFDQMAAFDVAASVKYVVQTTGQQQISWVGHSQGCMIALGGFLNETVAQQINLFVALAPAARLGNIQNKMLHKVAPFAVEIVDLLRLFNWKGEFLPNDNLATWLGGTICSDSPVICEEILRSSAGFDTPDMNVTRMPVYFTHFPAGTSGRNMVHYAQGVVQDKFQYFDYGRIKNLKKYKSPRPPQYDLKKMKVPTAVFSGTADKLADPIDVQWLIDQLPNLILARQIQNFAHGDFTWGINANTLLYPTVISLLHQHAA